MLISSDLAQLPAMPRSPSAAKIIPAGRPAKVTAGPHPNNLRALRKRLPGSVTQEQIAKRVGMAMQTYGKYERGESPIKVHQVPRFARALGVDENEITGAEPDSRLIDVIGFVGGGAEIYPIDDGAEIRKVECPRGLDPQKTAAVEVRGDSMYPINDGWVLFYSSDVRGVPFEAVGHMCVVKIAPDGPTLVKHLRRGYTRGRFNLLSTNASPIEDVALDWAAPIRGFLDPELSGRRPAA